MTKQKDPLEGVTLEMIVVKLVENYGWELLGQKININCFNENPSVKSSLTFFASNSLGKNKSRAALYLARKNRLGSARQPKVKNSRDLLS
jgi:uncharacterized protein (DUF2132 family)